MGRAETMGSQGGDEVVQESKWQSLGRQGSLYRLTLDEVESQLQLGGDFGKPLGSMNMEELLKSVQTAEANDEATTEMSLLLHRQQKEPIIRDLRKKTVDEVWRDIQLQQQNNKNNKNNQERQQAQEKERLASLGEMTLEDFLAKAGVAFESGEGVDPIIQPQQQQQQHEHAQWMMQYQLPTSVHQQQQHQQSYMMALFMKEQRPLPVGGESNPISETRVTMSPSSNLMGTLSDTQTPGRKRVAPRNVVEKTVERRQKRMIKNRESAARSRARRQAYTHELENKVLHLEEENERLKRQKEVEKVLPCVPPPEPKYQLRRTRSTSF